MSSVDPGPRDHLITERLERALRSVELDLHVVSGLDPAEAAVRLARHAMDEIRREAHRIRCLWCVRRVWKPVFPGAEAELAGLVRTCLRSDAVRRAVAAGSVHREVPFTVPAPDGGYAVGRADLVFREGDRLVVVDYKSDTVADAAAATIAEAAHAHNGQGLVYAAALTHATGLPVCESVFVFARGGGA